MQDMFGLVLKAILLSGLTPGMMLSWSVGAWKSGLAMS
jgi:hypothetical protein